MTAITQSDILDAMREAMSAAPAYDESAVTTEDLTLATGLSVKKVRSELKRLMREGRCERVTVMRRRLDDVLHPEPAYRLK